MIPDASPDALNLLNLLLQLNPDKRLSADQALRHPYVRKLVDLKQNIIYFYFVVLHHKSTLAVVIIGHMNPMLKLFKHHFVFANQLM